MKIHLLLIFTIIICCVASKSYAQDEEGFLEKNEPLNATDSLYITLIKNYIFEHEKTPNRYIPKNKSEKILYIDLEHWIHNLPTRIMDYKIVFLDSKNKFRHYKENNNQILSLQLYPLYFKNKIFTVGLNEFYSKIVKNKLEYLRIGMSVIDYYKYELGKLVYFETTFGGTY